MTCGVRVRVLFPIEQRLDVVIAPSPPFPSLRARIHRTCLCTHGERERKREEERGKAKNPLPDSPHLAARRQLVLTQFNKAINAIKTLRSVEERCEQS